jgi:hypothetical protein
MSAASATGRRNDYENNHAAQISRSVPRQQRSYANSDTPGATRIISETDRVVVPAEGQPAPQMVQSLNRATSQ